MKHLFDYIFGSKDCNEPYSDIIELEETYLENEKQLGKIERAFSFEGIDDSFGVASFNNTSFFYVIGSTKSNLPEGYN